MENKASKTAEFVAVIRAAYNLLPDGKLMRDPVAVDLVSPLNRFILKVPFLRNYFVEKKLIWGVASALVVLCRARFNENALAEAMERGVRQYVLLGAGLDSFAFRCNDAPDDLTIFEIDHPLTQALKLDRIKARKLSPLRTTHYVPVNFETESVVDQLKKSSFDENQPASFAWLGVVHYLTKDTIIENLRAISDLAAPGSEIVFDHIDGRLFDDPHFFDDTPELKKMWETFYEYTKAAGEPLLSGFTAETLKDLAQETGWKLVESTDSLEHTSRYLNGPPNFTWPTPFARLARLIKE